MTTEGTERIEDAASAPAEMTVMIVEDETLVAAGLRAMLEQLGYRQVHVFSAAEPALEQLAQLAPDLMMVDIRLGSGMDGLAAAREVMEQRPCPVIVTTAYTEERYIEEAMQAHVFGYLVKPVSVRQLATTIKLAQQRFAEFARLRRENETLRETLETRKLVERAKGVLMEKRKQSEQEAYALMRSQSQQQSLPMREIARRIIEAAEFL